MLTTPPNLGPTFRRQQLGHFRDEAAHMRYLEAYERAFTQLPSAARTRDVVTSFGTVRAYRFGPDEGVPMLLLPGRGAATPMWQPNLAGLARHRPVWAIDLLGDAGLSVQTRRLADADHQATWLAELLDGLDIDTIHLLGVSFGGWSALNLAIRRPAKAASLIVLDPANTFGRFTWKVIAGSLGLLLPVPAGVRRRVLAWIGGGADIAQDDPVAAVITAGMRDFTASLPAPSYPTDKQIAGIQVPVLVLIGGRSIIHNAGRAAERARRLLQHGTVELWPDASHAINGELPERIDARVTSFLAQVAARR